MGKCIGIDLGTTYSAVGVWQNDRVEIIANDQGDRTTPSWVAFTEEERLLGASAKNQVNQNIKNTIYDMKRLVGRDFDNKEVQQEIKQLGYEVVNKKGQPKIKVEYKGKETLFTPEEISSMVLIKMKERYLDISKYKQRKGY